MGSTHLALYVHLVWGTKDHLPTIHELWRERLHTYLGGVARGLKAFPEMIGGVNDHVHVLLGFKATHRLSDLLREIKNESSNWVHENINPPAFAWQDGYGAFTVSPTQRPLVRRYIERQEIHHRRKSFREEYEELLRRSGIDLGEGPV